METEEKKPKRPRIGQRSDSFNPEAPQPRRFERVGYSPRPRFNNDSQDQSASSEQNGGYTPRHQQQPYGRYQQPYRPNNYQTNRQNSYNTESTYTPSDSAESGNGTEATSAPAYRQYNNQQGGYRNNNGYRPNNNRQGGYRPNNNQGGYRQNNNQGGYRPNNNQGGYRQNNQGGYRPNNNQGGYRQNNNQGGYRQNNNQGGYRQNNQGGYRQNNQQGGYRRPQQAARPGKSFVPRPKRIEYEMPIPDPNEQIRLNKFMANAGICSRREADEYIQQGLVKVNGEVTTELGTKITHSDVVEYDGKVVALESKCYILLNKPKDCVTTSDDPNGRLTVMDLVKGACNERIYPVGRLDRNTTGVLLLTNDGDLASKLTHPQYVKKKIYHVWCDKDIAEEDMQRIADGIELEDGPIHADEISYATETDRNQAGIEIHSGRNRIVRRIFESLGYHVTKLDRVYFAGLTKKNLPRGRWRYLTQDEVNFLKMGSFE
ncbi:MAG: pseudouridine synthase [Bacteroidales bacterium]|nr:pseudouridine synthase [Bacteroidales bacterium]MBD5246529.1 pseudouridine synthase [Barnesiella sp.]